MTTAFHHFAISVAAANVYLLICRHNGRLRNIMDLLAISQLKAWKPRSMVVQTAGSSLSGAQFEIATLQRLHLSNTNLWKKKKRKKRKVLISSNFVFFPLDSALCNSQISVTKPSSVAFLGDKLMTSENNSQSIRNQLEIAKRKKPNSCTAGVLTCFASV